MSKPAVSIVEGKDPEMCAARRCSNTPDIVMDGELWGVSYGVAMCQKHADRMEGVVETKTPTRRVNEKPTTLPGISGTPPQPPEELLGCECAWNKIIDEWVFLDPDDYDETNPETYVRASEALGIPAATHNRADWQPKKTWTQKTNKNTAEKQNLEEPISEKTKAIVVKEKDQGLADLAALEEFEIENQDDLELAGEMLSDVQSDIKRITKMQDELLVPFKASVKSAKEGMEGVKAFFAIALEPRNKIKALLKSKISSLENTLRERNQKALEEGKPEEVMSTADAKGFYTKEYWGWDIIDFAEIPDKYKKLNTFELESYAKNFSGEEGDVPELPGLIFKRMAKTIPK